jgi:molybdopterin/thiamine biosynthesis adenylyltransferase
MMLDDLQTERYSRQIILPEIGAERQEQLMRARVLFVALEPAVATALVYLAAAGAGRVGIADAEVTEHADLAAPLAFARTDIGCARAAVVADVVRQSNPNAELMVAPDAVSAVASRQWDAVLCGDADAGSVAACNRATVAAEIPLIVMHASPVRGWLAGLGGHRPQLPCRECIRTVTPQDRVSETDPRLTLAALSLTAGTIGMIAATETAKLLLSIGQDVSGRLILFEPTAPAVHSVILETDARCTVCRQTRPPSTAG